MIFASWEEIGTTLVLLRQHVIMPETRLPIWERIWERN